MDLPRVAFVFLCFLCRLGSTDLPYVYLGLPLLPLPSGFHGSPLDLLRSSSALPVVRFRGSSPDLLGSAMSGFCRPAPGCAVSSCTLPAIRVPRISSRVFLGLPVLLLPSGFHGSLGSSWVFLYSSCRQVSTDLSRISLGFPVLCLPSGFHGSHPGLLGCSCTLPTVRVPRISPPGLLGSASASLAVGFHGSPSGLVGSPSLVMMDQETSPRSAGVSLSCFGRQEST